MIIGMNYDNAGERHIVKVTYDTSRTEETEQAIAKLCAQKFDEVYILNSYMDDRLLTDYVVTKGCRI